MSMDDFSDVFFYENQLELDVLIDLAEDISDLRKQMSESASPELPHILFKMLYLLGSGLLRRGIYGEGVKCYEEALSVISQNPSQYLVDENIVPLHLLPNDKVPLEFGSIIHTLTIFYLRTKPSDKLKNLIVDNIFIKRGYFFQSWLVELCQIEVCRKKCLNFRKKDSFKNLIGVSREWCELLEKMQRISSSDDPVLITGPSGVGKELVARAIHMESGRANFVALNCAAFNDDLIISELFGTEAGAFTGAIKRPGLCHTVGRGTLFLDEIGISSSNLQGKMLRLLQEREFMSIGGRTPLKFEGRIIAATNKNIPQLIHEGSFLQDLYWRLNVHEIDIPPLSIRPFDIEELIIYFVKKLDNNKKISYEAANAIALFYEQRELQQKIQGKIAEITDDIKEQKNIHEQWGITTEKFLENNVRELENEIKRLFVEIETDRLTLKDLPEKYSVADRQKLAMAPYYYIPTYAGQSEKCEKEDLRQALSLTGDSQTKVSKLFGCTPQAIHQRKKKFSL
ncbi:MAG: sigma 54-interacting transcriptional regulator [Dissulfurispiraceae bacterium]